MKLQWQVNGKLAATRLGRRVFLESLLKAMLASGFGVVGALFPLILCAIAPSPAWLGLTITIIALSGLGALLARTIYGSPLLWGAGHFVRDCVRPGRNAAEPGRVARALSQAALRQDSWSILSNCCHLS
jgi:hypothetical protein